jgi:hypothetical protein
MTEASTQRLSSRDGRDSTMKRTIASLAVIAGLAFAGSAQASSNHWASTYCGSRVIQPNTDWGVTDVRATHVACSDALRFAARWDSTLHPSLHGFRCHATPITHGLAGASVRCTRGRQRISFNAY